RSGPYSLETETFPVIDGLAETAQALKTELREIVKPMEALSARLQKKLHEQADALDSDTRKRIESVAGAITWRTENRLKAWIGILEALTRAPQNVNAAEQIFVDWMGIERADGQAVDVGVYRHWIDPMKPFAAILTPHAHGIAVTSATLRAGAGGEENDDQGSWESALRRTGAPHFTTDPQVFSVPSPFDYAAQTRLFIVNDVNKNDMDQLAATYRVLFEAAGGGALGLFTAIHRLKAVQSRITAPLEEKGFPLYAQHVDGLDTSTLVDMFRTETHACLLGTDAVRDGVDVPGESLRLLVYDRVPWPRPTILHKARRRAFGGRAYDEEITRLKLRQAFGRLIRRADDRGVFVMLDGALPSNLQNAFPVETPIVKAGLADTVRALRDFYAEK
ncbi:MAG: ATP-dependent DNA helicase, partial [Alphaproteobacteria bacterium]|nr:ATP-dependent DNA helicase [Alphaproteobacteria bacterium]